MIRPFIKRAATSVYSEKSCTATGSGQVTAVPPSVKLVWSGSCSSIYLKCRLEKAQSRNMSSWMMQCRFSYK